jgi:hypothetical protein
MIPFASTRSLAQEYVEANGVGEMAYEDEKEGCSCHASECI